MNKNIKKVLAFGATTTLILSTIAFTVASPANAAGNCSLVSMADPGNAAPEAGVAFASGKPKLAKKATYKVGFSQNASNNPWRLAETASMKKEAKRLGYKLVMTDANNSQSKQIADIKGLIAQKLDAIFVAPITEQLGVVVEQATRAGIPVFLIDRDVDHAVAKPGIDYLTVMQSDFVREGYRAAVQLAKATNGKAEIIELEGTTGSSPAIDRKSGFDNAIKACPDLKIISSQDGDFSRAKGQSVAETLLQAHPNTTAIYAHNDEMALGAISAIKAMGKIPGKDIMVISIDGEKDALKSIIAGDMYASVECSPHFGPLAFATLKKYAAGKKVPVKITGLDRLFTAANAKENVDSAF